MSSYDSPTRCTRCNAPAIRLVTAPTVWTNDWDWPPNLDTGKVQKAAYRELAKLDGTAS